MNAQTVLHSALMILCLIGASILPIAATATWVPEIKTEDDEVQEARVFHILVRTQTEIERARLQIRGESRQSLLKSFMEVARRLSIDPSSSKLGGDLGMVREGQMVKEFERAVFSAVLNETSEPVQSPFGWHLIFVTEKSRKAVRSICSEGLAKSFVGAKGRERSLLEFSSRVISPTELHPSVLEFIGQRWSPPLKDEDGNLAYLSASRGRDMNTYTVLSHTEYLRPIYNAHPQGCSRSARREYEVLCGERLAALKLFQEFEGRAASGRVLKNYPMKNPKYSPALSGSFAAQLVRTACE